MDGRRMRIPLLGVLLLVSTLSAAAPAHGQLPSPARDAAEDLLAVVRSGDEERLRTFIERRYTSEVRELASMADHLRIFARLRTELEDREATGVELRGPTEVSIYLEGSEDELELRLSVEPEPPHRITGLSVKPI